MKADVDTALSSPWYPALYRRRCNGGTLAWLVCCLLLCTLSVSVVQGCPTSQCPCQILPSGLMIINCRFRSLSSVPRFTDDRIHYEQLTLAQNNIRELPADAFITVTTETGTAPTNATGQPLRVRTIDLSANQITRIDTHAFRGLDTLLHELTLHVSSTAALRLPSNALATLRQLTHLKLEGFAAENPVPDGAFASLTLLKELTLSMCRVVALHQGALRGSEQTLETLSITSNQMTQIPSSTLNAHAQLSKLDLSDNLILRLNTDSLPGNSRLQELLLNNNQIDAVEPESLRAQRDSLKTLTASNNLLRHSHVSTLLNGLTSLTSLTLDSNRVESLQSLFVANTKLSRISVQQNQVQAVDSSAWLGVANSLRVLNLHGNRLTDVPVGTFTSLSGLRELNLGGQNLSRALRRSSLFQGLSALRKLQLDTAGFDDRHWSTLSPLTTLTALSLTHNHVTAIGDHALARMSALESLDMTHNALVSLTQAALNGVAQSLRTLTLIENRLVTFRSCALHRFTALRHFELRANPLRCDCSLRWLRERLEQIYSSPSLSDWVCGPGPHQGRYFYELTPADFCTTAPPPDRCDEYDVTTTDRPLVTSQPRTDATVNVINHGLSANISAVNSSSFTLQWRVLRSDGILGYILTNRRWSDASLVNSSQRWAHNASSTDLDRWKVTGLTSDTSYRACVSLMLTQAVLSSTPTACVNVSTSTAPDLLAGAGPGGGIAGAVVSIVAVVVVMVTVSVVVVRRRRLNGNACKLKHPATQTVGISNQDNSFGGGANGARPKIGYNSKRFTRPKNGVIETNAAQNQNASNRETERRRMNAPPSAVRGDDPRYPGLSRGGSQRGGATGAGKTEGKNTLSTISSESLSPRYVPEVPLPRPPADGYLTPTSLQPADDPDMHLYSEIPADRYDGYYEIPSDMRDTGVYVNTDQGGKGDKAHYLHASYI